jgi:hypothetical protein
VSLSALSGLREDEGEEEEEVAEGGGNVQIGGVGGSRCR